MNIEIPERLKSIIEKTCKFLSENGSHEEYLLKSKTSSDENFGFLFKDNMYHPYYKALLDFMKSPESKNKTFEYRPAIYEYKPPIEQTTENSSQNQSQPSIFIQNFYTNNGNQNPQPQPTVRKKNRWSDSPSTTQTNNMNNINNFNPNMMMNQNVPQSMIPPPPPPIINYQQNNNTYGQIGQNFSMNPPTLSNIGNYNGPSNYYQNQNQNYNNYHLQKNIGLPFNILQQPGMNPNINPMNQMNQTMNFNMTPPSMTAMTSTTVPYQPMMSGSSPQMPIKQANEPVPTINCVSSPYKTVEVIPVGAMAEMWKYQKKNNNMQNYQPMSSSTIPSTILTYEKLSDFPEHIKIKMDQFYKFVDEEREYDRRQRRKKEKEKENETIKVKEKYESYSKRDIKREVDDLYTDINDYNPETGMRNDGQILVPSFYNNDDRQGIGGAVSESDIYAKFRKQRSYQYHVSAEERSLTRDQPELCFVCQMPGHIAKDCKFGLT